MKKIASYWGIAIVVQIFILIGTVKAVPVVFTSEAAWLSAVTGSTVIIEDFQSTTTGTLPLGTTDLGEFDVSIGGTVNALTNITGPGGFVNGSTEFQAFLTPADTTSLVFSGFDTTPIIGFAGDWGQTTTQGLLTMEVNGTLLKFNDFFTVPGTGFLGIVDTVAFSSVEFDVEIAGRGELFALDNVRMASVSAVAEPATMTLLGIGLVGLVGASARRRCKKKEVVNS